MTWLTVVLLDLLLARSFPLTVVLVLAMLSQTYVEQDEHKAQVFAIYDIN